MARRVKLQRREGVARITLGGAEEAPIGGGFDADLRAGLAQALASAIEDPDTRAIVIRAGLGGWPRAADPITDYAHEAGVPDLAELANRIADAPVPVIAALSGVISGGALALAQAARWRIAQAEARFSAPEFGLGVIPAAGGLVRLAQRSGALAAYEYLTAGVSISAADGMSLGLCDALTPAAGLKAAALGAAQAAAEGGAGLPERPELAEGWRSLEGLARARQRMASGPLARVSARATEVVEAALLLPIEEALDFEAVAFEDLAGDELSLALRHGAAARRATLNLAGIPEGFRPMPVQRVALWNQPDRLALGLLARGLSVQVGASDTARLEAALKTVAEAQVAAEAAGRISAARREAEWARIEPVGTVQGFVETDFMLATPRPEEVPDLRAALPEGAVLAIEGAEPLESELGFVRRQGLVTISAGAPSGQETRLLRLAALLQRDGSIVVHGRGLVARLEAALISAAERAVLAGATPLAVDRALVGWGFGEGPFARLDRIGLEATEARMAAAGQVPGAYLAWLGIEGRTGRAATGLGVYDYRSGEGPQVPSDEAEVLTVLRAEAGITPRRLGASEIVARILAEMAGAGAAALQTKQAHRASDLDLVALLALGFPPYRGGPMFQADRMGLLAVRKRLRALGAEGASAPVTLWDVLIRNGRHFADL